MSGVAIAMTPVSRKIVPVPVRRLYQYQYVNKSV
jgi:hypothetical protein